MGPQEMFIIKLLRKCLNYAYVQKMDTKSTPDFTMRFQAFPKMLIEINDDVQQSSRQKQTRQHGPVDPSCIERNATKHCRAASGLCAKKPEGLNKAGYHQTPPKYSQMHQCPPKLPTTSPATLFHIERKWMWANKSQTPTLRTQYQSKYQRLSAYQCTKVSSATKRLRPVTIVLLDGLLFLLLLLPLNTRQQECHATINDAMTITNEWLESEMLSERCPQEAFGNHVKHQSLDWGVHLPEFVGVWTSPRSHLF